MSTRGLDTLITAIDDLLGVDPAVLDDVSVEDLVVGLVAARNRLDAAIAHHVQDWDRRRVWARDGSKAAGAHLARATGMRKETAYRIVQRARKLETMPHTTAAFTAGTLTAEHVDLIAGCNRPWPNAEFADHEHILVDICHTALFSVAVRAVEYWKQRADPDGTEQGAETGYAARRASVGTGWRGMVHVDADLDPIGGVAFTEEVDRICERLRVQDLRDGRERTIQQRRADALVEMAHRSATAPADGLRPRPLITILLGDDEFARTCQTAAGTTVSPNLIVPLLADADIERIIYDPPARKVEASYRRSFVGALRRIIQVRDRHCQHHSGCDEPMSRCDVDHIVARRDGGITCLCNGQLLCRTHNRIIKNRQPPKKQREDDRFRPPATTPWIVGEPPASRTDSPRSPPQAS